VRGKRVGQAVIVFLYLRFGADIGNYHKRVVPRDGWGGWCLGLEEERGGKMLFVIKGRTLTLRDKENG